MFTENSTQKKMIAWAVLLLTVVFLETVFFRSMIFNNDNIVGDLGDSRLVSLILEHWYKVFCGKEGIRDLSMFYPVKNTLGYSDALFLLSLPYSVLRVSGISWLTAYQLTLIIIHFFGGICLAWFLRKSLKLPLWTCIIGLIIGNFSNSYFVKISISHSQFITHSLVPLLFIFLKIFYDSFTPCLQKKRMIYGILSIFLFAGILLTSFYVGFFCAFFLLTVNIVIAIYLLKINSENLRKAIKIIKAYKFEILIYIVTGIVVLLPFLWIYLPIYKEMGGRNIGGVLFYLPYWYDFFNVSPTNLIWSFPNTSEKYELMVGYPLITGIILIIGCVYYIRQSIKKTLSFEKKEKSFYMLIGFSFAIAIISLLLLKIDMRQIVSILEEKGIINMKQIGSILDENGISDAESKIKNKAGFSLWFFAYFLVPGASAMWTVVRFNQFLSFPAGIIIACFLSEKLRIVNKNYIKYWVCIVLIALIFFEHQNTREMSYWTKSYINSYLEKVSAPPESCESFLLVNNDTSENYVYQLDAWTIANKYNIKTINGYSGQSPKNWYYIYDMESNRNYSDILRWIDEHNLENVYLYDYKNDKWIRCTESVL
ncbi:MAG: hypothetical protein LBC76_12385 [Treponema sp.]|jgi:hypothetical protein|nr:hypothetical protein [Treponema sp.]